MEWITSTSPKFIFSHRGWKNWNWWPEIAAQTCLSAGSLWLQSHCCGREQVTAAYNPVFFTVSSAHLWHSVYNIIQTQLPGIKVLFLLLLINAKIPTDFAEIKSGLKWPTIDICENLPNRNTPLIQYAAPYGWPSFRLPQQLPEAVMLTVVMTIKITPTEMVFIIGKIRPASQDTYLAYCCWLQYLHPDWHWSAHGLLLHRCDTMKRAEGWAMYTCAADLPYAAWLQLWKHWSMQILINLIYSLPTIWG